MHIPITDAVRTDRCILIDSVEDFFGNYPILKLLSRLVFPNH
jgi:hypothetical protein